MVALVLSCVIPAGCALSRQRGRAQHPSQVVLVPTVQVDSAVCVAGPLTDVIPAGCALSRQRGRAQHPSQVVLVPTVQVDSAVCVAGPLTDVIPAGCALSRQRGRASTLLRWCWCLQCRWTQPYVWLVPSLV
jgi:ribosomal protein L27